MKTGTNTNTIIHTPRVRPIKCDCSKCVNKGIKGCRFGWEPIKGKCTRYGSNHYHLTKEEKEKVRKQNEFNKQMYDEKKKKRKTIYDTSFQKLSAELETNITIEMIEKCDIYRRYGNGKYAIKCVDKENCLIRLKNKNNRSFNFRIIN